MKTESKSNIKEKLSLLLDDNPDLFQQYPELLESINLPDTRGTASLLEHQVKALKQRLKQFNSRQTQLIEVARENEQIGESFSKIIYQLIGFDQLSEFSSELPATLRSTFEIDEVSFKTSQAIELSKSDGKTYSDALRRLAAKQAVCDNRWPSSIMALFFSETIKSAALIPMQAKEHNSPIGILALGSNDSKRYTNDLGTAHLDRLGVMTGVCLARLQPKN